jgi:hypothetical protein
MEVCIHIYEAIIMKSAKYCLKGGGGKEVKEVQGGELGQSTLCTFVEIMK